MSLARRLLNPWLRRVEKRRLRNGSPETLRKALEVQARLFFHPPFGTSRHWTSFGNVPCLTLNSRSETANRVLFYIHGGGFVFGSPNTHSAMAANLAHRLGARAIMPKYRLAPEAAFPAAPQDVRDAWDGLLASGVDPASVVIGGDSAGGALAFGLVSTLCEESAPLPGAVFGFSPLTDLTYSGESFERNAESDVVLPAERAAELAEMLLQGHAGNTPSVSPLFGTFKDAPPAWITVGDTEILLDDARRLAARLEEYNGTVDLVIEKDLPHVWPIFHNILPEGRKTLDALAFWIRQQQNWEA
ncbi:alpha/beta hydrolase [Sulfitobacter sp. F26169L]|uniref:alpha/beta hydrolase n=1 Tax=Sulfitobacter sp. F26169L TaxID=2996015 RepID=UPI0022608BD8|nr:alpha/beta hydrolase [Sulfitobacter sp. F26169L]MCX7567793.1 alpha/beta hydrolase [Sulfitobacter sp. F26169L]